MEKICVIGLGYIGLPTASLLATKGFSVHGVDVNEEVVEMINYGKVPIYEPDLDILVRAAVQSGNLIASTEPVHADIFIIAVPTPFKDGYVPDISHIEKATYALAPCLTPGCLVVLESTSPVGTTEKIAAWLREQRPDLLFPNWKSYNIEFDNEKTVFIAHCPERVLPGQILRELVDNDRIIGGIDKLSANQAQKFYKKFVNGAILTTDSRTAELAKLTENAFRDVNIAFANELSIICDTLHINVWELIELTNRHPRVNILHPGPGVGGHCIAVDPWFIVDAAPEQAKLIRAAREINNEKPNYVFNKIKEKIEKFKKPVIACLGLAFKPDIDDLRESPALEIVKRLSTDYKTPILVVEPHIVELPPELARKDNVKLINLDIALLNADILVVLLRHKAFMDVDLDALQDKVIIDTCGIWR